MSKQYHIFNRLSRDQHGPIDFNVAIEILEKESDLANWYYWQDGNQDWQLVESNSELHTELEKRKKPVPPPPPPAPVKIATPPPPPPPEQTAVVTPDIAVAIENTAPEITQKIEVAVQVVEEKIEDKKEDKKEPEINKRKNIRLNCSLRAILTNKKKTFITTAVNISVGGIRVKHSIPMEIFTGVCEIYISGPEGKDSLVFKCHPAQDGAYSDRFIFKDISNDNLSSLNNWLQKISVSI